MREVFSQHQESQRHTRHDLVPKLCLGTHVSKLRFDGIPFDVASAGHRCSKQSFDLPRSQAELGNERCSGMAGATKRKLAARGYGSILGMLTGDRRHTVSSSHSETTKFSEEMAFMNVDRHSSSCSSITMLSTLPIQCS